MDTFPESLKILSTGFTEDVSDNTLRSSMDVGPAKVRERSKIEIFDIKFNLILDDDEKALLKTFYTNNKSILFKFKRPDTKELVNARFKAPLSFSSNYPFWNITLSFEILP